MLSFPSTRTVCFPDSTLTTNYGTAPFLKCSPEAGVGRGMEPPDSSLPIPTHVAMGTGCGASLLHGDATSTQLQRG